VGTIVERQLVRHQQLAEHPRHIEQPELWHVQQRFQLDCAEHERSIEHERRELHVAEHIEQPELWHLEHDLPQHERSIGRRRRELLVA
jgi:hypothetical protein